MAFYFASKIIKIRLSNKNSWHKIGTFIFFKENSLCKAIPSLSIINLSERNVGHSRISATYNPKSCNLHEIKFMLKKHCALMILMSPDRSLYHTSANGYLSNLQESSKLFSQFNEYSACYHTHKTHHLLTHATRNIYLMYTFKT